MAANIFRCRIDEIGTLKCYRKIGLAKSIINKIIEDGKLNAVMKIWIPTNINNEAACALYRSIGADEPKVKDEIIYNYRY
ncbi:GNAT family N-acetyltransferase [Clostridium sp. 19966]|uniref:GNAT family N-acetyltransferase n=1 Tax=Clostridium sp. 19966 TaxID=2768166 RepID=UPI0028DFAFF5|nr:GNAT family N-acetyltransferase [Clostridium sp. 19966]MDT8719651.1 GNAT family N-acetyltransferase [Clostridium sp. 19966]